MTHSRLQIYLNQEIPHKYPLLLQSDLKIQQPTDKLHDLGWL